MRRHTPTCHDKPIASQHTKPQHVRDVISYDIPGTRDIIPGTFVPGCQLLRWRTFWTFFRGMPGHASRTSTPDPHESPCPARARDQVTLCRVARMAHRSLFSGQCIASPISYCCLSPQEATAPICVAQPLRYPLATKRTFLFHSNRRRTDAPYYNTR